MPAPPRFDVFNGDADGICALHQLRLNDPAPSTLITGVKRQIRLLEGLRPPPGAQVTVLDVSLRENGADVRRLLEAGCRVRYFDHHDPGEVPRHPALEAHLDTAPDVCTSLLVDRALGGAHRAWAVAAAFGDNLHDAARRAATPLGLEDRDLEALRELGELLNYNAYGDTVEDLHFHPAALYRALSPHPDPLEFFRNSPQAGILRAGYAADMASAEGSPPALDTAGGRVVLLPGEPWARRVQGVHANRLASGAPDAAVAVGVKNPDGSFRLSIRAPLNRPRGADALARRFPGGGGRTGAAGIENLPSAELPRFLEAFSAAWPGK